MKIGGTWMFKDGLDEQGLQMANLNILRIKGVSF